jgi:type IV pilus biogenesis protein CpaD/CtpE
VNSIHLPRLAAVVALVTLAIAGCTSPTPGAAAVLGDTRISETALTTQVQAVLAAQGKGLDTADAALTAQTLDRMVKSELVDMLATSAGIEVTQGQIDTQLTEYDTQEGSRAEVEKIFLEQGIAPSQIPGIIALNLQANAIGLQLAPDADTEVQGQAVVKAIAVLSELLKTEVSPRYGTWDAATLQVGPAPDDLSSPPAE